MGTDAKNEVGELDKVLKDPKIAELTRIPVAQALGRIGAPEALAALPTMKEILGDTNAPAEVRRAVAESLGKFGKDSAETVPLLGKVLASKDTPVEVRRTAATALDQLVVEGKLTQKDMKDALKEALNDKDKFVRCLAMHALGQVGKDLGTDSKVVAEALLRALDDNILEVRVAALETFGNLSRDALGEEEGKAVQERMTKMTGDPIKEVREAAENALKKFKKTP